MSSTVIPCLRYRDAPAIMEWLCRNLGFEKRLVIPGTNAKISHAELTLGGGMVMIGSHADDSYGQLLTTPESSGGLQTQTIWIHVDDADDVYARVVESGATIVMQIDDVPQGGPRLCLSRSGRPCVAGRHLRPLAGLRLAGARLVCYANGRSPFRRERHSSFQGSTTWSRCKSSY